MNQLTTAMTCDFFSTNSILPLCEAIDAVFVEPLEMKSLYALTPMLTLEVN